MGSVPPAFFHQQRPTSSGHEANDKQMSTRSPAALALLTSWQDHRAARAPSHISPWVRAGLLTRPPRSL